MHVRLGGDEQASGRLLSHDRVDLLVADRAQNSRVMHGGSEQRDSVGTPSTSLPADVSSVDKLPYQARNQPPRKPP